MTPAARVPAKRRPGNKRVTGKEQYYTPAATAQHLTNQLVGIVGSLANHTVIEPAGGTGAFIEAAMQAGAKKVLSWDIEPHHSAVKRGNFLEQRLPGISGAVTLGNPPFGRNNALSIPFFNHAAEASDFIAFIVPRSWRKWSVSNRLDRRFHLVHDVDLQLDYVDAEGEFIGAKNRLATCFQIWEKRAEPRLLVKVRDMGLVAKATPADADVSLTVFGFGCGQVKTEFERKPNTTQMFLKLKHPGALSALQSVDFARFYRNTAYTEALSFQEINYLLNEAVLGDPHLALSEHGMPPMAKGIE